MDGLMSYNSLVNPLTYNWNKVWVGYCDGGSFLGDVDEPVKFDSPFFKKGLLYFRGKAILEAVYDSLLRTQGLDKATDVIVSGSSAGGLSVMLNIDKISKIIKAGSSAKKKPKVVGVVDAGFFLDVKAYDGKSYGMRDIQNFKNIIEMQNVKHGGALSPKCLATMSAEDAWKCMLPQYFLQYVDTPLFIVQSIIDSYQWQYVFRLDCEPKRKSTCSENEIKYLKGIRKTFANAIRSDERKHDGWWVTKCLAHTIVDRNFLWQDYEISGKRLGQSVIAWYEGHDDEQEALKWRVFDDAWDTKSMDCADTPGGDSKFKLRKRNGLEGGDEEAGLVEVPKRGHHKHHRHNRANRGAED